MTYDKKEDERNLLAQAKRLGVDLTVTKQGYHVEYHGLVFDTDEINDIGVWLAGLEVDRERG